MKNLFLMLLCFTQYSFAVPYKIVGKITKPVRSYILIKTHDVLSHIQRIDTVKLADDGTFKYGKETNTGEFVSVYIEVDSIRKAAFLVYAGGLLNVNFLEDPKKPELSGTLASIQYFAGHDTAYWKEIYEGYVKRNPLFQQKEFSRTDAYFKILDSITDNRIRNLKAYFKKPYSPIELAFVKYRETSFIFSDLFYKQSYPNAPYQKFKFYQDKFKTTSNYTYKYSDLVNFNNPSLYFNDAYYRFFYSFILSELTMRRENKNIQFSWTELINSGLKLIDELSFNQVANQNLKAVFLANLTDEVELNKNIEAAVEMNVLLQHSSALENTNSIKQIKERVAKIIKNDKFKKGKPAPDFEFTDLAGLKVKLIDLRGKKIIIDVAAAWCTSCIAGIPSWNKKVEENKDPDIVYIFLSLDDTRAEGLSLFTKHQPKGELLFAGDGGFKSKFGIAYEIGVLPNQIVIDKYGNLESYFYN